MVKYISVSPFLFFLCKLCEIKDRSCKVIPVCRGGTQAHVKSSRGALCPESMSPVQSLLLSLPAGVFLLTPQVQMYIIQSLFYTSKMRALISYWARVIPEIPPDQQPRSYLMLTKVAICATSLRAGMRTHTCS